MFKWFLREDPRADEPLPMPPDEDESAPDEESSHKPRHQERVAIHARATIISSAHADVAAISNLSSGGAFLETSAPPPIGTAVVVYVQPESGPELELKGRVYWQGVHGCGVAFVSDETRWALDDLLCAKNPLRMVAQPRHRRTRRLPQRQG